MAQREAVVDERPMHMGTMPAAGSFSDVHEMAMAAFDYALRFCMEKMGLEDSAAVLARLSSRRADAHGYFSFGLAKDVSRQLAALDSHVKGAYIYDFDAALEDDCFSASVATPPIHMIVWAERKTAALGSLIEGMDRALLQRYNFEVNVTELSYVLDIQVIDDADVASGAGYGAMLSALHYRPIQVWRR